MISEPALSHESIGPALNRLYAIDVRALRFVSPGGECSWGYVVEAAGGERYFLKLTQQRVCGDAVTEQGLVAAAELASEIGRNNIVAAIQSITGYFLNGINSHEATLTPLIDGKTLMATQFDDPAQHQLGALIARIHNFSPMTRPPDETLASHQVRDWIQIVRVLDHPPETWSAAQQQMAALVRSVRDQVERMIENYTELAERVANDPHMPLRFCHGDPSPGNVIIRPDGDIALIDWDAPVWGPKECDLFFVRRYPAVLAGYRRVAGALKLNDDLLALYQLVWDIGEVVDYGYRSLLTRQSEAQYEHDVRELTAHVAGIGD